MKHIYGPNNDYPLQFGRPHGPLKLLLRSVRGRGRGGVRHQEQLISSQK